MSSSNPHRASDADAGRLEQILRFQESLLLGEVRAGDLPGRICQGATLLIGAAGARLATLGAGGALESLASYGAGDFAAAGAETPAARLVEGGVSLNGIDPEGRALLTVALSAADSPTFLQLSSRPHVPFSAEQVALARYAATLVTIALRQAGLRERLERADHAKSEVLVALSHDLRTPLNVLIGYTRLLTEEAYGPCTPAQQDVLGTIERHALELLSLLSGALDLVRLEFASGEPQREEFSLAETVRELCSGSLAHRVANGVELLWHVDPAIRPMRTDRFRVRQILQNLVDNALRFTEHGSVEVAATAHESGIRLIVRDTGPGIASSDMPHLFELFRSGAGESRRGGGTGCGLYLVKRFTESLGGRVSVESAPGAGTRFIVDLPPVS